MILLKGWCTYQKKQRNPSEYVGIVGKRQDFNDLTCVKITTIESTFGTGQVLQQAMSQMT